MSWTGGAGPLGLHTTEGTSSLGAWLSEPFSWAVVSGWGLREVGESPRPWSMSAAGLSLSASRSPVFRALSHSGMQQGLSLLPVGHRGAPAFLCSGWQSKSPELAIGEERFGPWFWLQRRRSKNGSKQRGYRAMFFCVGVTPEEVWFLEWQDLSISTPAPSVLKDCAACPSSPLPSVSPQPLLAPAWRVEGAAQSWAQLEAEGAAEEWPLLHAPPSPSSSLLWRQGHPGAGQGGEDSWCWALCFRGQGGIKVSWSCSLALCRKPHSFSCDLKRVREEHTSHLLFLRQGDSCFGWIHPQEDGLKSCVHQPHPCPPWSTWDPVGTVTIGKHDLFALPDACGHSSIWVCLLPWESNVSCQSPWTWQVISRLLSCLKKEAPCAFCSPSRDKLLLHRLSRSRVRFLLDGDGRQCLEISGLSAYLCPRPEKPEVF